MKYQVKVIHAFVVEAESEEEAEKVILETEQGDYSNAKDCYLEVEKL